MYIYSYVYYIFIYINLYIYYLLRRLFWWRKKMKRRQQTTKRRVKKRNNTAFKLLAELRDEQKKEARWERKESTEQSRVLFHAALFHFGTPLVACSTAEAASQSPLLVRPVTLHHWGQRALFLPVNEPASASAPPSLPKLPQSSGRQKGGRGRGELFFSTTLEPPASASLLRSPPRLLRAENLSFGTPSSWDGQMSASSPFPWW